MIASVLAFAGCQNEELANDNVTDNSGKKVVLTANIQGAADSRVALTSDTDGNGNPIVKVAWRAFDSTNPETFAVYDYYEYNSPTTFTQLSDNVFEGTLPESSDGYCAYYNKDLWMRIENTNAFPQDGTLREQDVLMYAVFDEDDTSIEFMPMTAILKPTFTLGGESINSTITSIKMGGLRIHELVDVDLTVDRTSQGMPLAEDIFMTIPVFLRWTYSSFKPGATFTFAVKADGKDYTGSLTISPFGEWNPYGKLFTANIALTEKVNPAKNELRYDGSNYTFYVSGPNGLLALNKWMTSIGDDSHNEFTSIGFPVTGTLSSNGRLASKITLETDIILPLKTSDGTDITFDNDGIPSGSNWIALGDLVNTKYYSGVIDGGNYTIKNLVVSNTSSYQGFVNCINYEGIVKNLKFENVHISGASNCGAVVGFLGKATVENCHVLSGSVNGSYYVGGIVGNTNLNSIIRGCINNATINATNNMVGGIVGHLEDSNSYAAQAKVVSCANLGVVNGAGTHVGGIVGNKEQYGTVIGCWTINTNEKDENGTETSDENKDGIGYLAGTLTHCYSAAKKSAEQSAQEYINGKVNDMNSALSSYGWKWVSGVNSGTDWPTLQKN